MAASLKGFIGKETKQEKSKKVGQIGQIRQMKQDKSIRVKFSVFLRIL